MGNGTAITRAVSDHYGFGGAEASSALITSVPRVGVFMMLRAGCAAGGLGCGGVADDDSVEGGPPLGVFGSSAIYFSFVTVVPEVGV
jgi:hypothetical protein